MSWFGLLLVDKPEGPTSHDVVATVRRGTGERRIGHTGTLDPLATGLLPLAIGPATRLIRFLPHSPKTYVGTLLLGQTTDSDDITGAPLTQHEGPLPDHDALVAAARTLTGALSQRPPAFSARKVAGERLYKLARRGVVVEVPPRDVQVDRFDLETTDTPSRLRFEAVVSAGTYIRSLVRDLGLAVGCGAVMESLRRTTIGPLSVDKAIPLAHTEDPQRVREALLDAADFPLDLPRTTLSEADLTPRFRGGQPVPGLAPGPSGSMTAVLAHDGTLLGVAEWSGTALQPRVVLP